MKLHPRMLNSVAALAVVLSGLPLFAQATLTETVKSDTILPQDTYLYVSVPNVDEVKRVLQSSSFGQMWNDPSLEEFKEEVMNAFENEMQEALAQFQAISGMTVEEALAVPNGEITLAISAADNTSVGAVLFFDVGNNAEKIEPLLGQAAGALSQNPNLLSNDTTFDGTSITAFEVQHPGPSPSPMADEFGWFLKDGRFVVSNQMELLEELLENWDGEARNSLANNDTYSLVMSRCGEQDNPAISKMYFDPIGMFTKLIHTQSLGPNISSQASLGLGFLPVLGLSQLKAVGAVGQQGSGDLEMVNKTMVCAEQPPTGVMQMFQLSQTESTPPSWVKDNVSTYMAATWKIDSAYTSADNLLAMFQGPRALSNLLDKAAEDGPQIHLKNDVLDNLTGLIRFIGAPNSSESAGGEEMVLALEIRNERAVSDIVSRIAEQARMESTDFQGTQLFSLDTPMGQAFTLAVKDGHFFFGVGDSLMGQVLRNDDDLRPLSESEDFQRVADHYPADAVSVSFSRPVETYRSLYNMVRDGGAEQFPGIQDIFEKIDVTRLPPFEKLEKYFHAGGTHTTQGKDGYFVEAYQMRD